MGMEFNDLAAFLAVAKAGGFRDAARASGVSASGLSVAVRRLEASLGVRLLNRTTRSVAPTEAGQRLIERLTPVLSEMEAALDVLNGFRDKPTGTLRLNVPAGVARAVAGCDAGIRYDERLEQDMVAIPIGPRVQRFATAATSAYLDAHGRPTHPRDLLAHACLRAQFASGATPVWEFERDGEVVRVDPTGPLRTRPGAALDLIIHGALEGLGVAHMYEELLRPHIQSGALEAILEPWWQTFGGPFLYYPGRQNLPTPLRAFVDFIKTRHASDVI
jgi:DNA-binding transcriptional LysR family regulator